MKTKQEIEARALEILLASGADCIDTEQATREMIDEVDGDVTVCGMKYSASRVLEEMDPTAFRCTMLDYIDYQEKDNQWYSPDNGSTHYPYDEWETALEQAQEEADAEEELETEGEEA